MKVIIFSHIADVDGMGCVVLAKNAFPNCDYVFVNYNDVDVEVSSRMSNLSLYNYDKIFITDISLSKPLMKQIGKNEILRDKFQIIDHHEKAVIDGSNKYPFAQVQINSENGMCCGTSLFYDYLLKNNYLKESDLLDQFVELTRRQDTWEWKTIYNDRLADDLAQYFNAVGRDKYIKTMCQKLKEPVYLFEFTDEENEVISEYRRKITSVCKKCLEGIKVIKLNNMSIGIVEIDYKFRNEVAQYIRDLLYPIDILALPNYEARSCSFRSIGQNVDVNEFAMSYNGGGHKNASSCPINEKLIKDLELLNIEKENIKQ